MIAQDTVFFQDPEFPIQIASNRTSVVKKIMGVESEIHEAIEIKVFREGRATLLIGNRALEAKAGDVIIMNPYEFHATVECGEEKSKYHLIMVSLDFFTPFLDRQTDLRTWFFSEKKAFQNRIEGDERLLTLLQAVVEEWESKPLFYRVRIRALMTEVLTLLFRYGTKEFENKGNEQRVRHYRMIEPALRSIRKDYGRELDLTTLANLCCVNKYYFCRVFKEVMGCSPMQYLCGYRLHCADILLRNTTRSVTEVLYTCGFRDESYFYRCYRKHFGITPYERRKKRENDIGGTKHEKN